jgi:hypothetical protein
MGVCLLLQAAPWFTGIVGGVLLAVVVLSMTTAYVGRLSTAERSRNANFCAGTPSSLLPIHRLGVRRDVGKEQLTHLGGRRLLRSWPGEIILILFGGT